jgi:hypothetical protein
MRAPGVAAVLAAVLVVSACRGVLRTQYEYEEELYLDLDGSATLYVNASVPALVALRGLPLDPNPRARLDRQAVRAMFSAPGVEVRTVTASRRNGRRFVHVRLDVERLADLERVAPLSWSSYELARRDDVLEFRQLVGAAAGVPVSNVGWTGDEIVAFRMHLPSRIPFHNAPSRAVQRGNILEWEQPLAERLEGVPIAIEAHLETHSILSRTLLLFGSTIVAAAFTFALLLWWLARRGRESDMAESRP